MIIGVDAAVLGVTDDRLKVGVYHFVLNLLENLADIDKKNKYLLYSFDPVPRKILGKFGSNWINLVLRPKKGWLSLRLSAEFLKNKPDIFLGLGQSLPIYHPAKNIVFVYDLAFELYPTFYKDSYKRLSRQTKFAVKNCEKIVTISQNTKNDLVKFYSVDSHKINVIYHGVEKRFKSYDKKTKKGTPYFLFVGSYKPGKNIDHLIKAFKLFTKEINKPYELYLVGSNYWVDKEIVDKENIGKIKILGYVAEDKLPVLYREAAAFVSPSFYEGFGVPFLEAMASGIPVIASDCGSIPEIVGNAAILVDPTNIEELKKAMMRVVTDDKLRSRLIAKGFMQAKNFSSVKSARQLLQTINRL